jgi:hypothetical protein
MKTVAEAIGVSRSNLIERLQDRPRMRIGRPPLPDNELVATMRDSWVRAEPVAPTVYGNIPL